MPIRPGEAAKILEAANGSPQFLGLVTATTTTNNHTTGSPFNNTGDALMGKLLIMQPDAACYVLAGITNAAAVTTANGVQLQAGQLFPLWCRSVEGWLAVLAVTGTVNLKVWEMV